MKKWDYLYAYDLTVGELKSYGSQGWELINFLYVKETRKMLFMFKRELE